MIVDRGLFYGKIKSTLAFIISSQLIIYRTLVLFLKLYVVDSLQFDYYDDDTLQ